MFCDRNTNICDLTEVIYVNTKNLYVVLKKRRY